MELKCLNMVKSGLVIFTLYWKTLDYKELINVKNRV